VIAVGDVMTMRGGRPIGAGSAGSPAERKPWMSVSMANRAMKDEPDSVVLSMPLTTTNAEREIPAEVTSSNAEPVAPVECP